MDVMERNRSFGWWCLLCWLTLGMLLEAMHGFKVGWYLDVVNEPRRLQLTLAHSHGTLLAIVNLVFVATARAPTGQTRSLDRAGACLRWAGLLMPMGFLLGGVFAIGPDPGFAIALVPIGGFLLFTGVLLTLRSLRASAAGGGPVPPVGSAKPDKSAKQA
jgi:membrane protein DedA with SNARE-associated domain